MGESGLEARRVHRLVDDLLSRGAQLAELQKLAVAGAADKHVGRPLVDAKQA